MEKNPSFCSFGSIFGLERILKILTFLQLVRELILSPKQFYPGIDALFNMQNFKLEEVQSLYLSAFLWLGNIMTVYSLLETINPRNGRVREFGIFLWIFAYFTTIPIGSAIIKVIKTPNWQTELQTNWDSYIFLVLPHVPILILGVIHNFRCKAELTRWDNEARIRAGENRPLIMIPRR